MLAVRFPTAGPFMFMGGWPRLGVDAFSGVESPEAVFGGVFIRLVLFPLVQLLLGLALKLLLTGVLSCWL